MTTKEDLTALPQQELLRVAMDRLGMTRAEFAARLSIAVRTLDKWLLPSDSPDSRSMPDMGRAYVLEILQWQKLRKPA
ncbi:transcriptional regulator [Burkholderia vietnamiensis]|uniref:Transcriptional regulator n=1 Tax=Burkholderia vietnamiensis TaxID=60552 RepID=A0AAW7T0S0_BURVI|nr:transcriptional regulator [Burkholderia vietnamiensis]MBH9645878.1 transcriptional regulator [Burkholderia vietnamiensis]MBR8008813.1 transcriptional regulator [Burkholderia vietnamiensis]MDN7551330.1 transcriptional regulator [Burkholderia vietnamiensis]MDN7795144.1 transcriptional regulator [Burkholderia vietnamiensis]MDN8045130.1 transcriptional regulator [Burkholderia vietnamiensis]